MRSVLVAALVECAESPAKNKARRFLTGLSSDELQFIAGFLGARILETTEKHRGSRAELAELIAEFQRSGVGRPQLRSDDQEHKMILLLEYMCRSGLQEYPAEARAEQV